MLTVNGVVVPLNSNGTFSHTLTLNPSIVFNPIETRIVSPQFRIDRRVVIAGESVADGDYSFDSLALRLNDSGLDALEPVVTSLVDLDLATLVPPGTQVINEFCVLRIIFCTLTADAFIEGSPPPSIGSFSIDIDSQPGFAFGDILLNNLFIRVKVQKGSVGIIGFTCHVNVSAVTTDIEGDFGLEPMVGDPQFVDVEQIGGANVLFGGFSDSTDCDGIFGGILELFIGPSGRRHPEPDAAGLRGLPERDRPGRQHAGGGRHRGRALGHLDRRPDRREPERRPLARRSSRWRRTPPASPSAPTRPSWRRSGRAPATARRLPAPPTSAPPTT